MLRQALESYDPSSPSWKRDFDAKSTEEASASFEVLYDALSDRGGLAAALASLISAAGKEGDAFLPDGDIDTREFLPEPKPQGLIKDTSDEKRRTLRAELDVASSGTRASVGSGRRGCGLVAPTVRTGFIGSAGGRHVQGSDLHRGLPGGFDSPAQRALVKAARAAHREG